MKSKLSTLLLVVVLLLSACAPTAAETAAPTTVPPTQKPADTAVPATATTAAPVKLNVCYSANSAGTAPLWYAQDKGLFAKYGLEVNLTFISSGSDAVTALITKDVDLCEVSGAAVVNAVAAKQDAVLIAGFHNKYIGGFYTKPEIKTVDDLRGKTLGISKPGSSSTVATTLALQSFGLVADQDVTLVSVGSDSDRLTALEAGEIDGAVLSPPSSLQAEEHGFYTFLDMTSSDIPYQFNAVATSRAFTESNRAAVTAFMKAVIESIALMKADPDGTKAVLANHLDLDPVADASVLDGSYKAFVADGLESVPYPTLPGLQTIIDTSIDANPDVASVTPDMAVDTSIVQELEDNGFITSVQP